ncbi:DUF1801 domain-containing protein [Flavobacteriaceae bacterium M23B6Z8]
MKSINLHSDPRVLVHFESYPDHVKTKMYELRKLILDTATEIDELNEIEETLKWGEPAYKTNIGSTLRIDWKPKSPDTYALYFQCSSRLVETFRMIFKSDLMFEGKRAIILKLKEELPEEILKSCIKAALTYHKVKQLPTLGI